MCGLFGFYNYSGKAIKNLCMLTNCLAEEATIRGTDAAGIAYNDKSRLVIHKEPKSAYNISFKHPDNAVCVTGHTRHEHRETKSKIRIIIHSEVHARTSVLLYVIMEFLLMMIFSGRNITSPEPKSKLTVTLRFSCWRSISS